MNYSDEIKIIIENNNINLILENLGKYGEKQIK